MMTATHILTEDQENVLDEKLVNILLSVGISANLQGYTFLKESIKMVVEDPMTINRVTKVMYPNIAKKFDTTPCRVERAIRHALEVSYNRGKIYNLNQLFGLDIFDKYDKPTNSEFVAVVADRLCIDLKNM
ncbi:MAG: sporulation initiation factor Spo0A C-terminal domain-containing protein [Clostridia bacterium]|nr:sporulation initiation factor Spo0A C-terminal domain-containing protein [Clostridia bacterium]